MTDLPSARFDLGEAGGCHDGRNDPATFISEWTPTGRSGPRRRRMRAIVALERADLRRVPAALRQRAGPVGALGQPMLSAGSSRSQIVGRST